MYSISLNQNKIYSKPVSMASSPTKQSSLSCNNSTQITSSSSVPLGLTTIRTTLSTQDEKKKYSQLSSSLGIKGRMQLNSLLKSGKLLDNNSNDKSTTLENLHKIISSPRADGLDSKVVLKETVAALENPCSISQRLGDIPKSYKAEVYEKAEMKQVESNDSTEKSEPLVIPDNFSSSCVSASIEFILAKQYPSEFARFAQCLTSPNLSVEKVIDLKNLTEKTLDSIWLLNNFKLPYELQGEDKAKLTFAPDKNAIIRAKIQNSHKDGNERSLVDVLMQSTFMNIASQQSYDSLTDTRGGKFSQNNRGLVEFEKTFTESVVENKSKTSVCYQIIDENNVLSGYTNSFSNIEKHIDQSLKAGSPVVIGYTIADGAKNIVGGHEVTIFGQYRDKNNELYYVYNDTDDEISKPVVVSAKEILPRIHHAGLSHSIVKDDISTKDAWEESLENYKNMKQHEA